MVIENFKSFFVNLLLIFKKLMYFLLWISILIVYFDYLDVNNGFIRRFLGFLVVVLNMIDYNYGVICYYERKYNKYMIFFIVDFFCFVVGWYVIFYNERCLGISYLEDYS